MISKVALVAIEGDVNAAYLKAINLLGGIEDLNASHRKVVVKVGVFEHRKKFGYPTVEVVRAITEAFIKSPGIYLAESDNYRGTGSERLQIYKELFSERIHPFNLSEDEDAIDVEIAGEHLGFSNILFKPNVFVSVHALRKSKKGTILKNLLGLVPSRKKAKYHKKLETVLLDSFRAIGGIDLAVLDAVRTSSGPSGKKIIDTNILLVGRDAVAVEAVGADLTGLKVEKIPLIQKAVEQGLGVCDLDEIEILGEDVKNIRNRFNKL